jgi:DHA2 family multidrug resistance protein
VSPYNRVMDIPSTMGAWSIDTASGLAKLSNEIARQSLMIGYTNAWLLYTIAAVLVIPLCLLSKAPKGGFRPS